MFDVVVGGCREPATLHLVGTHNIYNALAAVAVGLERGSETTGSGGRSVSLAPADKRGPVVKLGNITIINDCYNSNPTALMRWWTRWRPCRRSAESWWRERCWNSVRRRGTASSRRPAHGGKEN